MSNNTIKKAGRVYTPDYLVKSILDLAHYAGPGILKKHVIDNSCGDGAFLVEIVKRYCETAKKSKVTANELKEQLETYIHGIEIDPAECETCRKNLTETAKKYCFSANIDWDILCEDTLTVDKYNGQMDYVVGNPPYVRVHHLENAYDSAKKYLFAQNGMIDLYIVFYEIGLNMLNGRGVLGYITPSSFFSSLAGKYMRHHFVRENLIEKLVELKHYQAFDATTYTTIVILNRQRNSEKLKYYRFDEKSLRPYYVGTLFPDDYYIAGKFYFSTQKKLALLKKIFYHTGRCGIEVKNGYATLCDSVFVGKFGFDSPYIIPVVKASRGEFRQIIYPYDQTGKLVSEKELSADRPLYEYLLNRKETLRQRSAENQSESHWYAFGRSQAIKDTYKNKVAINALMRASSDLKFTSAPVGTGVYGGLYLIGNRRDLSKAKKLLRKEEFSVYISLLGKYKSGGYYTFSSKDIKSYLDYKLSRIGGTDKK